MLKLVKKYALISTSFYEDGKWKNFHILRDNLSEKDVIEINNYAEEYNRLWRECYQKEQENAKNRIIQDLRTELKNYLNKPIPDKHYSINDYYKLWLDQDLITEHYVIEDIKEDFYENM
jgi:hypothetical protein